MAARWRHEEIAQLLAKLTIKSSSAFLEKSEEWTCPACRRSKAQIVAPGQNVDIIACVHRHHDHITDLIWNLTSRAIGPSLAPEAIQRRQQILESLGRRFRRFGPADICHACNSLDPAAKAIVRAPPWFSFSPHGISSMIKKPIEPYAVKHEIDRDRLSMIWDKVSREIDGLEERICRAIQEELREVG